MTSATPTGQQIKNALAASIEVKKKVFEAPALTVDLERTLDICVQSLKNDGCLYFCGNGGSAADAQHLAAELTGRFYYDRPPLAAEALHANSSFVTAVANDYSYDEIFSRALLSRARKGDVILGFSTSGNSKNILKAFEAAKSKGVHRIGFTGESGGQLKELSDVCLRIPSKDTPRIQEVHITLGHILCALIEERMFPRT